MAELIREIQSANCLSASFKFIDKSRNWLDPVHRHSDDKWWFCDETWGRCWGPYETEKEANEGCTRYAKEYLL